jgi:tetratricopeptide (TPR) repeat protein
MRIIITTLWLATLTACSAALVPYTSNPDEKVAQAKWLFESKYRALPAEKLLNEAKEIYLKDNNMVGLAEFNRIYGLFLNSHAVDKYEARYIEKGFIEPGVTYENRYDKSIEYYKKTEKVYIENEEHDSLTNIYLLMGFTYSKAGKLKESCLMLDKSIEENNIFSKNNPEAVIKLAGFSSYTAFIEDTKSKAGCSV